MFNQVTDDNSCTSADASCANNQNTCILLYPFMDETLSLFQMRQDVKVRHVIHVYYLKLDSISTELDAWLYSVDFENTLDVVGLKLLNIESRNLATYE